MTEFKNYLEREIDALGGGQSGASALPQYELGLSTAFGIPAGMLSLPVDQDFSLSLAAGPALTSAATPFYAIILPAVTVPADAPAPACYLRVFVSNAEGTEQFSAECSLSAVPGEPLSFPTGTGDDWIYQGEPVGTDLSIDPGSGAIISAAGGVFWITLVFTWAAND